MSSDLDPSSLDRTAGLDGGAARSPEPPDGFGRYRELQRLGSGGMATVYRAYDPGLDRVIALKLLLHEDPVHAERLLLEARAQVTIARSFQFPEVRASGSAPYTRIEGDRFPSQAREQWSPAAGFDIGFEIDLWGRFRRGSEAARAELLATEAGRRFVVLTLVTDVAATYFNLRSPAYAVYVVVFASVWAAAILATRSVSIRLRLSNISSSVPKPPGRMTKARAKRTNISLRAKK